MVEQGTVGMLLQTKERDREKNVENVWVLVSQLLYICKPLPQAIM
jgi:hypothetical protein